MTEFDEAALDDAADLAARDESGLLWSLATAGAQVRRAMGTAGEFDLRSLGGADMPRSILIATDAPAAGRVLTRLSCEQAPAQTWHGAELPRWAGPADTLLVGAVDGRHPRLADLADQGVRRGLATAVVAPAGSPVAAAAGRAPLHELPAGLHPRASRWSVLTPLLQVLEALGVHPLPRETVAEIVDALDGQAAACRPDAELFVNPAKALAAELADAVPLIVGAGPLAGAAARTFADTLTLFAGIASVQVTLPDGVGRAESLIRGAGLQSAEDDLFRDRVDDVPALRLRLLMIGDDGAADDPLLGDRSAAQIRLDEMAARQTAQALHRLAESVGVRSSSVEVPSGDPLARFAAATAFGDFTAAYLALGRGVDPGGDR